MGSVWPAAAELGRAGAEGRAGAGPEVSRLLSSVFPLNHTAFLLCPSPRAVTLTSFSQSHPWLLLDFLLGTWPQNWFAQWLNLFHMWSELLGKDSRKRNCRLIQNSQVLKRRLARMLAGVSEWRSRNNEERFFKVAAVGRPYCYWAEDRKLKLKAVSCSKWAVWVGVWWGEDLRSGWKRQLEEAHRQWLCWCRIGTRKM